MRGNVARTRAQRLRRLAIGLAALLVAGASAARAEPRQASRLKSITDGTVSETGTFGRIALSAPVHPADDGGLLLDLSGHDDDRGSSEVDLGTGYRYRFESGWDVGARTSIDRRQSTAAIPQHRVDVGVDARRGAVAVNAGAFATAAENDPALVEVTGGRLELQTRWLSLAANRSVARTERSLEGEAGRAVALFGRDSGIGLDLFAGASRSDTDGAIGRRGRAAVRVERLGLLGRRSSLSMNGRVEDDGAEDVRVAAEVRLDIRM
jgi:hypothetical protein